MSDIQRSAARILVRDRDGAVLLLQGIDPVRPQDGSFWFTPGGGLEADEDELDAAIRELREETGLDALPRRLPVERDVVFPFLEDVLHQHESWFVVDVERFEPDTRGWTELERRTHSAVRWWTPEELAATSETVYPSDIVELLRSA